ncbi:MAG: hypothetical protein K2X73_06740 [Sphingomonas sp.]|uniref:hypothetical protein n=1 Tax=Sphingomonas sp. TaxID=28214 RepID=UPI0025D41AF4|nr:hypothetical protein [Sphingomonas sp.]MBX9881656.1 hypothetical protein [Sphingomonas sp.]
MAVSLNYPSPVNVNGFACWNCGDVAMAKRDIDPAHPASGPHNKNAASDPSRKPLDHARLEAVKHAAQHATQAVGTYSAIGVQPVPTAPGAAFQLLA